MRLLYFCEKPQDTFYKRHMRPGGQGTKPALSFQQGTELFLLSTKSQRKEKKDIKGIPNHGHTFCREEASWSTDMYSTGMSSHLSSPGGNILILILQFIESLISSPAASTASPGGLQAPKPKVNLQVGEQALSPPGHWCWRNKVLQSKRLAREYGDPGGEHPRTKYVFGVFVSSRPTAAIPWTALTACVDLRIQQRGSRQRVKGHRLGLNTAFKTIQDPKKLLGEKKMFGRKNIWSQVSLYLRKKYICNIYIYIYKIIKIQKSINFSNR